MLQIRRIIFRNKQFTFIRSLSSRRRGTNRVPPPSSSAIVAQEERTGSVATIPKNPWIEKRDPNGSGLTYFWNTETNETTPLGYPKPMNWIPVNDPSGSGLIYWWDPESNTTTALGEPKPAAIVPMSNTTSQPAFVRGPAFQQTVNRPQSFAGNMVTYATLGAGMTLAMIAVRAVLG